MAFLQSLWRVALFHDISSIKLSHAHRYLLLVDACIAVTRGAPTRKAGSNKRCSSN